MGSTLSTTDHYERGRTAGWARRGIPLGAGALSLALAACSLIGADGADEDAPGDEPVSTELELTEVQLPGEYDDEGHRTSQWHMLPGDDDLPALAVAVSQVMGRDEATVLASWTADTGEMFAEHTVVEDAGSRVRAAVLGGDTSVAVIAGYRTEDSSDVAFLLTSTDRQAWQTVDLGEHAALNLTAAGGSENLIVATDSSADDSAQVVVVDDGELTLRTLAPQDPERRIVVTHAFVHGDRIILSGREQAPGESDVAAIWISPDRGREFIRTAIDEEGSVAGVTRAGTRYFAAGHERQGEWLRPRIWTSGNGQDWWEFTMDYDLGDLDWAGLEEHQGLGTPLGLGGHFYAALWGEGARRVQIVYHNRDERWSGIGHAGVLPDFGVRGLAAPDGEDARILLISPVEVRQHYWGEDLSVDTLATLVPGASVDSLLAMEEGIVVTTRRPAYEEMGEGTLKTYREGATYPLTGDWLPEGLEQYAAQAVATNDGARLIVGAGGAQWDRIPLWFQDHPDAPWTRHWIESDQPDIDAMFATTVQVTPTQWYVAGDAGGASRLEGRSGAVWASADGREWHLDAVLAGPDGRTSHVNDACIWQEEPIVVGGYRHPRGGSAPGLWHRADGQWHRVEVDEDWHGSLTSCRVDGDVVDVRSGDHRWTTTDLVTFTAEEDVGDDDAAWSSPPVEFDDGRVVVTGAPAGVELEFDIGSDQRHTVPLGLDRDFQGGVAAVRDGGSLLIAERDTGRAWRIDHVADLLSEHAALASTADTT